MRGGKTCRERRFCEREDVPEKGTRSATTPWIFLYLQVSLSLSLSIVHLFRFAGNEDICFRVLDPAGRCLDAGVAKNTRRNIPLRTFHHLFFILLAHFISLPLPPLPIFLSLFLRTDPRWSRFENNV